MPIKRWGVLNQTEAAKRLGVTREHLNRVLRGHRESRSLMKAYADLVAQAEKNPLAPKPNDASGQTERKTTN